MNADDRDRASDVTRYVAHQVRNLRRERHMTAEALVDAVPWAGLGRTQIVKLESGRRQRLSVDELLALATALRVPATSLLPPGAAELNQDATPAQVLESVIEVLDAVRRELVQNHCPGADDER